MTLRETYTAIEAIATQVPDVRTVVENDITRLNEMREAQYGVFGITQEQHSGSQGWMTYTLNLFFIDRLLNSQDNEVQIQSHAIDVLRAIVIRMQEEGIPVADSVRYTAFTERFQDLCAGAWAVVTIQTPASDCNDIWVVQPGEPAAFDSDFNEDFDI